MVNPLARPLDNLAHLFLGPAVRNVDRLDGQLQKVLHFGGKPLPGLLSGAPGGQREHPLRPGRRINASGARQPEAVRPFNP
jgi:hypothetical protein